MKDTNPKMQPTANNKSVVHISAASILAKSLTLLIGQPFDGVKTRKQAYASSGTIPSTWDILYNTWKTKGVTEIYKGFFSNLGQSLIKSGYRGPLMIKVPQEVENYLPEQINYPVIKNIISAGVIGLIDAGVICPWEWAKVRRITSQSQWSLHSEVMQNGVKPILLESYVAYRPLAMKETLAWASFFILDDWMKSSLKQFNTDRPIPYYQLMMGSFLAGGIKVAITNPVDVVKTLMQKENPQQAKGMYDMMKHIVEHQGMVGLMRGGLPRYIHAVLAIATGSIIRHWWEMGQEQVRQQVHQEDSHLQRLAKRRELQESTISKR